MKFIAITPYEAGPPIVKFYESDPDFQLACLSAAERANDDKIDSWSRGDVPGQVLTYGTGFSCIPEEGAKAAYLLNCAESVLFKPGHKTEVQEILGDYVDGDITVDQAVAMFADIDADDRQDEDVHDGDEAEQQGYRDHQQ